MQSTQNVIDKPKQPPVKEKKKKRIPKWQDCTAGKYSAERNTVKNILGELA